MLKKLRQQVFAANMERVSHTWGNASGIDREKGLVVIKPSGVEYDKLTPDALVVVDLMTGRTVWGSFNPSSDTKTRLKLYKESPALGGIVHTHSPYAVGWAQAGQDVPCFGTTHADYFIGPIPCTRHLSQAELDENNEKSTGTVIIETFSKRHLEPVVVPGVIYLSHGPFAWGHDAAEVVYHASM